MNNMPRLPMVLAGRTTGASRKMGKALVDTAIKRIETEIQELEDLSQKLVRGATLSTLTASLMAPRFRLQRNLKNPEAASLAKLKLILAKNLTTEFGKDHSFDTLDSVREFQSKVPIRTFDELSPYISRAAEALPGILTHEDVIGFEKTSGSSSYSKLIPYTRGFLSEIESIGAAWLGDELLRHPKLLGKQSYWAKSPHMPRSSYATKGGIPIGMRSDLEYFGPIARKFLSSLMVRPVPRSEFLHLDPETLEDRMRDWRIRTAAAILGAKDLGLLSVWSPTFLFPIFETVDLHWNEVLKKIKSPKRIKELEIVKKKFDPQKRPQEFYSLVWPHLQILSCWVDGPSQDPATRLDQIIPHKTEIEGKGLMAAEGVVTIPFSGAPDPVIAVGGHFIEFIDLEHPHRTPLLPHELKIGGLYSPVLTTSGGLYRYHLRDMLYCTGRNRNTPTLRYRGRIDKTSDLCGEDLNAAQVERAFEIAASISGFRPDFFLLAPDTSGPIGYRAFIEAYGKTKEPRAKSDIAKFIESFEKALRENEKYDAAIESRLLAPIQATNVIHGIRTWEKTLLKQGRSIGGIKLTKLDSHPNWKEVFSQN